MNNPINNLDNFKEIFNKIFKQNIPDNCLVVENLKYQPRIQKIAFYVDFFILLNNSLFQPKETDNTYSHWARAAQFHRTSSNTITYTHVYEVYTDEDESVIESLKQHKERIEDELKSRFKEMGEVSSFFRPKNN